MNVSQILIFHWSAAHQRTRGKECLLGACSDLSENRVCMLCFGELYFGMLHLGNLYSGELYFGKSYFGTLHSGMLHLSNLRSGEL